MTLPDPAAASSADSADWRALNAELDRWAAAGRTATLWWRDDDAVITTPDLTRLMDLAEAESVPLALAVIPEPAQSSLVGALEGRTGVDVLQHGWSHTDHAIPPAKKCELGADRPADTVMAELAAGKRRLEDLFGAGALPVLVPPWNRVAPGVVSRLAELGVTGLSVFAARKAAPPGLTVVNTHIDPIDWGNGKRFVGEDAALRAAITHLHARRTGDADAAEATGLLTHHLVMDAETWAFTRRFLGETRRHPAVRWDSAAALFGAAS